MGWTSRLRGLPLGGLIGEDGWIYRFSKTDVMWLARALVGEVRGLATGATGDAVAWTMAQNMYLHHDDERGRRDGYVLPWPHQFWDVLMSYAKPINPYWRDRGTEQDKAWRAFLAEASPDELDAEVPGVVDHAVIWCQGHVPMDRRFAGLVHWMECASYEGAHGQTDLAVGTECFFRVPETRGWTAETLRPVPARGTSPIAVVILGGLIAAGGIALVRYAGGWPTILGGTVLLPIIPP